MRGERREREEAQDFTTKTKPTWNQHQKHSATLFEEEAQPNTFTYLLNNGRR